MNIVCIFRKSLGGIQNLNQNTSRGDGRSGNWNRQEDNMYDDQYQRPMSKKAKKANRRVGGERGMYQGRNTGNTRTAASMNPNVSGSMGGFGDVNMSGTSSSDMGGYDMGDATYGGHKGQRRGKTHKVGTVAQNYTDNMSSTAPGGMGYDYAATTNYGVDNTNQGYDPTGRYAEMGDKRTYDYSQDATNTYQYTQQAYQTTGYGGK